ncbi:MAG: hypothetical protein JNK64_05855 [Myxococcales bacterium]|nr:hypothetical protein [Myxococcales bacterium]
MSAACSTAVPQLFVASTFLALAGPARAEAPAGRWEGGVGRGLGGVRVDDPALSDAAAGGGGGLVRSAVPALRRAAAVR